MKLLYIEDEGEERTSLAELLRQRGFEVHDAASGESGLRVLKDRGADVVLCDLNMPGMSGLEVLKRVKQTHPRLPFILLTGHGSIASAVEAMRQGAYDFVLKPLKIDEIETAIRRAAEASTLQRQLSQSEAMLQMILATVPDIIYSLSPEGVLLSISPAAETILGYPVADMVGTSVFHYIHPEDVDRVREGYRVSLQAHDQEARTLEFRMLTRAGEARHFEVRRRLILQDGEVIRSDGIARDVTERRKLEEELRRYSHRLEAMVEERTHRLEFANQQLAALNEVSNQFTQIFDEEELFDEVPELLTHSLGFDRATLFLEKAGGLVLRSYCVEKDPPELIEAFQQKVRSASLEIPPAYLHSLKQNKTIFIADVNAEPDWPAESDRIMPARSVVISSIKQQNKAIGVIVGCIQYHDREVDEQDVARFEMFANMVGLAIDNIRAYRTLERKVIDRTQALRKANRELRKKARELEKKTYSLGRANVQLLSVQEELERKQDETREVVQSLSQSKEELQRVHRIYREAIANADGVPYLLNFKDHRYEFIGEGSESLLGYAEETLSSENMKKLVKEIVVTGHDAPPDPFEYSRAFLRGEVDRYRVDLRLLTSSGEEKWVSDCSVPLIEEATGRVTGSLGIMQDITERKVAERSLVESEAKIRALLDAIPDLMFQLSREGVILDYKDAGHMGLYVPPERFLGKLLDTVFDPDLARQTLSHVTEAIRTNTIQIFEYQLPFDDVMHDYEARMVASGTDRVLVIVRDITERKQAEQALERERNFVSAILETAGALVIVLDTEGRIVRFNRACEETTGYQFEEVKGKHFGDIFLIPEEAEQVRTVFEKLRSGDFPSQFENYWVTKDGDRRLIAWSNTVLVDANSNVEYIIATGIDITERKQAEEKLRLYRRIFMNSKDAIAVIDREGRIVETNPAYQANLGYSPEDLVGKTPALFMGEKEFQKVGKALGEKGSYLGEFEGVSKDGAPLNIELSAFSVLNENGEVVCHVGFGRDISERKRAEAALRESEERFRGMVENANDIIYLLTKDGQFTYVSPNWTNILGHDVSEVEGKLFVPFVHPEDLDDCFKFLQLVVETGEKQSGIEYRVRHKDGSWRWHTTTAAPMKDDHGRVQSFVGIAHDITERKKVLEDLARANRELRETQAQLVQSEKMAALGNLVAGIAHEINTPIGAINSMHDTLTRAVDKLKSVLDEMCAPSLEEQPRLKSTLTVIEDANRVIESGSKRVADIVRRLRSFARLDEAELKKVDIHEGLEDTLMLVHHELKHRIKVHRNFGDIPQIACYPGRLNQVFLNLLVNAAQAIKDQGEITISTSRRGEEVHIAIKDTGVGIAPADLKRIFDPGFTTKGVGVGTGLGLSICYQIIRDHQGRIEAESKLGEGSTFTVILPMNLDRMHGGR